MMEERRCNIISSHGPHEIMGGQFRCPGFGKLRETGWEECGQSNEHVPHLWSLSGVEGNARTHACPGVPSISLIQPAEQFMDAQSAEKFVAAHENSEKWNRPEHYGGEENPFEPIKIIEHYDLNFNLGNVIKYVLRAPFKGTALADLKKAYTYIGFEIRRRERAGEDE